MKTKAVLSVCVLLGLAPVSYIAWYRWDSSRNRGFEFGYFGDFNRVRYALVAIPGITVTRDWANKDMSIQEFGFDITTSTGQTIPLAFQESDPTRSLSGESLVRALANSIQTKTSMPNAQ
ncbi:MAG: hypothetical protein ABIP85_19730, partial [Chthoniobacteraceae bacterium]